MLKLIILLTVLSLVPSYIVGHGMVLDPANRSSRWRSNNTAPENYNDNGYFCGGREVQWGKNNGKCGLCGDNYADSTPRSNELGGIFGEGIIVESYPKGSSITVTVRVTANHLGFFKFRLCNLDKYDKESDECFDDILLKLTNGDDKFTISDQEADFHIPLMLPEDLTCNHCVLQWTWRTGNSHGECDDGTIQQGCGAQEHFRTCSDITIV